MRLLIVALMLTGCGPMPSESDGGSLADAGACVGAAREALSGTRLRTRYVEGDDGSRSPLGFFDLVRNEACSYQTAEDGKLRCLPSDDVATVLPRTFVDAACMTPAAFGNCPTVRYARDFTATCPPRAKLFNATVANVTTLYTADVGMPCTATPKNPNLTYFSVGSSAAAEQWVAGTVKVDP